MANKYPRVKCLDCNTGIGSSYSGEWVACPCFYSSDENTGIYIDSTDYYTRMGGNSNYVEVMEEGVNGQAD